MFTDIAITPMFVTDYDEALKFYTDKLGFEVHTDFDLGDMRWLTVALASDPRREVLLQKVGLPSGDPETARQLQELTERGAGTWMILHTDDCVATADALRKRGVEIVQEPTEQMYGIDMAVRDPFGNQIRVTQEKEGRVPGRHN